MRKKKNYRHDNNQNQNLFPDYEEPFLRYRADRPEVLFGLDLNHNGVIESLENDLGRRKGNEAAGDSQGGEIGVEGGIGERLCCAGWSFIGGGRARKRYSGLRSRQRDRRSGGQRFSGQRIGGGGRGRDGRRAPGARHADGRHGEEEQKSQGHHRVVLH